MVFVDEAIQDSTAGDFAVLLGHASAAKQVQSLFRNFFFGVARG